MGLAVYDLLTYVALAVAGENLGFIWRTYGLFPLRWFVLSSAAASSLYALAIVFSVLCLMLGFLAVSVINIEELRGYPFLSARKAIRFALRRWRQVFLSELTLLLFLAAVVVAFALLGLVSRIPFLGEWVFALTFVLPAFVIALITVFVALVLQISVFLLPATAAADREGEVFNALLETFSTVMRQPVRWVGYTVYAVVAAKLCGFVFAYFGYRAVQFTVAASGLGGGRERLTELVQRGLSHLPADSDLVRETFNIFPGIHWSFSIAPWTFGPRSDDVVGYVMAIMLFLIFASVWGYTLAVVATAQVRGYAAIRFIKDEYRIDKEDSLFYKDEPVNPLIDEEPFSTPAETSH